jgi:hypothetical protein
MGRACAKDSRRDGSEAEVGMRKSLAAWFGAAAALIGIACGGDEGVRTDALAKPEWTLTFLSPDHGSIVAQTVRVEVAITGAGAARGGERPFELGFFIDDVLVTQGEHSAIDLQLEPGYHKLRVEAVDEEGEPTGGILHDEISVNVRPTDEQT